VALNQHPRSPSNSQHGFVCPKKVHQIPLMELPCAPPFYRAPFDVNSAEFVESQSDLSGFTVSPCDLIRVDEQ